jgi:glycosidase
MPASAPSTSSVAHAEWTRRATIYEVNVRQYTPQGTLAALVPHMARLKALGVDMVWLMPVQPIGVKNRKGPLGSYYSIQNYTAVNPEFGTAGDFKQLVDAAHGAGLKVILDWVPNHTAFDHPWITAHPDWYVHKPDGSISNARDNENHDTDWTDVAELNYDNRDMRRAMLDAMTFWLRDMHVDGFRCDVAGGVPDDFWAEARAALAKVQPELFMLAEGEGPNFHAAFDMTYGWELHHLLNDVAQGKKPVSAFDAYFARQDSLYPPDAYRMYFTSNHDENSWNGTEFERMGDDNAPAFVLAATAVRGMPLLYSGQEVSLKKRLRFFEKDTIDWNGPSRADFYRSMLELKHSQAALANGAAGGAQSRLALTGADRVYAYARTKDANTVLVALNFGDAPATVNYTGLAAPGDYTDWASREKVSLGGAGSLSVPTHGYRVLVR